MQKKKLLAMFRFHHEPLRNMLEDEFEIISVKAPEQAQQTIDDNQDIVAIASIVGRPVTANLIEMLPNLEIISNFGVGVDHIDVEAAKKREIVVANTPDVVTKDTADAAIGLLLNISRRFVEGDIFVRVGKWYSNPKPIGRAVWEKTIGIIGMGRIGQAIAKRAEAFDMEVIYTAKSGRKEDLPYKYYDSTKSVAENCDYLVLALPGGDETRGVIDRPILEALGKEGYLINIARGSIVNTEDLIWALENKVIAGAGLDVFEKEPFVPEELMKMDNVVLGPHIASTTEETIFLQEEMVLENLKAYFSGQPLLAKVV